LPIGHQAAISHALASYGATIASFLGAIHWGLAMRDRSDAGAGPYLWGAAPSLSRLAGAAGMSLVWA
jgi:hypothetical protein